MTERVPEDPVPVVIDASVAIAYVRDEPTADRIRHELASWAQSDRELLVPPLFWFEVVNVLARRHGYESQDVLAAVDRLEELGLTTVDPDRTLLLLTIDLVERHGLTAYDAQYLAVAVMHGAAMATLDEDLAAAAVAPITFGDGPRFREGPAVYEREVTWPRYPEVSAYLARIRAEAVVPRLP